MTKKTWKDRLVKEQSKLNKKIDKLYRFLEEEGEDYKKLLVLDQDLLMTQHAAMVAYLNVLDIRLKRLKESAANKLASKIILDKIISKLDTSEKKVEGPFSSMEDLVHHLRKKTEAKEAKEEDGRNS